MAGQLNVFGMASQGVNVDLNDVNMEDGMLRKSQNGIHDPSGAMGSVRKRPGLLKINSGAVSGSVFGITNVPLSPITVRRFLIGVDQDVTSAHQWITSTDAFGTTATAVAPGAVADPGDASSFVGTQVLSNRGTQGDGFIVYPGRYTRGDPQPVRIYNLVEDKELFRIPINPVAFENEPTNYAGSTGAILQMLMEGQKLYLVSHDFTSGAAPHYSRVLEYDFDSGTLQQIGQGTSLAVGDIGATGGALSFMSVAYHQGFLYAGAGNIISGETSAGSGVYRIRPGVDATWTYDFDNSAATYERPMTMASYKGKLYVGMMDLNSGTARIMVRSSTGAYTQSTTQGTSSGSAWVAMQVFGDNLYATSLDENGGASQARIHKFDGTSWSVVKTIDSATSSPKTGVAMVVHNSRLYVLGINATKNGIVTHTANGTSWTDITTNLTSSNIVSVFGVLTD